jgi:hypothetical protein
LKEQGIFRLSGSANAVNKYKRIFDDGEDSDFSDCYDCNVISGLLKLYLRELPDSLFTREMNSQFNIAAGMAHKH